MADTTRLRRLDNQMATLRQQMADEKKRIRQQEKKEDDRRKFLAGSICLQHAAINLDFKAKLESLLLEHVPEGDKYLWPELFEPEEDGREIEPANDNRTGTDAQAFREACDELGAGEGFIPLHRIREKLGWTRERFDDVLEQFNTAYKIELHGGDPSQLTPEEIENSYRDKDGQQFITMSWRG